MEWIVKNAHLVKRGTIVTLNYFFHFGETIRVDFCWFVLLHKDDRDYKEQHLRPTKLEI